jgi:hypothetical protein
MSLSPILNDLHAECPYPDLSEELMLFGQFVGTWDMTVEFFDDSGHNVYREPGTWTFGWVLDGRAIQDVLAYPPAGDPSGNTPGSRRIGTSLRFYHPQEHTWRVIWLGAVTGLTVILHGGRAGEDILLESEPEPDGTLNRWRFTDITTDSFLWIGQESGDDGNTWQLRQRMTATRRG